MASPSKRNGEPAGRYRRDPAPSSPTSPTRRAAANARRLVEENPNLRTIDLSGRRELLPRPPGDISADFLYRTEPDQDGRGMGSPTHRREEQVLRDKASGRQFLWPTMDAVVVRPVDAANGVPLPLAVLCSPFADGAGESTALPLSDLGTEDPLRCTRCRSYVNPYFRWSGKDMTRLQCNMCGYNVEVPQAFREDMDRAGHCADEEHHPEMVYGSVDFPAPGHYDVDRPAPADAPVVCFVLETSSDAVRSGFLASSLAAIRKLVEVESDEDAPLVERRVCLIAYDSAVHFFAKGKSGRSQMVTMTDLADPYLPLSGEALLMDPCDPAARENFLGLLDSVEADFVAARDDPGCDDVAGGPALHAAVELLSGAGGGDVVMFHASNPSCGVGALRPDAEEEAASPNVSPKSRRGSGTPLPSTPSTMATTPSSRKSQKTTAHDPPKLQAAFYEELLSACVRGSVAVSCVTAPAVGMFSMMDVPSLQWLPRRTGGETLHVPAFSPEHTGSVLEDTLRHWCEKMEASAYGCVVKVRTSKGLVCHSLLAPWPAAASAEDRSAFEVSRLSPDASFAFLLQTEEEPEDDNCASYRPDSGRRQLYVQVAVLYTGSKGERLLRVHNTVVHVLPMIRNVFNHVNIEPLMALLVKQVATLALEQPAGSSLPRDCLLEFVVQVLDSYRRHCVRGELPAQMMVLSKRLQLLPLYILGARKMLYTAIGGSQDKHLADEFLRRLLRMPVHSILAAVYPRIYSLPCLLEESDELPRAGFASKDFCATGSSPAFLIANSFGTWFYQVEKEGAQDREHSDTSSLSGSQEAKKLAGGDSCEDDSRSNPERTPESQATKRQELWQNAEVLSQRLRECLAPGPTWMPLQELERLPGNVKTDVDVGWHIRTFLSSLFVEDEGATEMDYQEWLLYVHGQTQSGS